MLPGHSQNRSHCKLPKQTHPPCITRHCTHTAGSRALGPCFCRLTLAFRLLAAQGAKKSKRLIPWPFAGRRPSAGGDCPGQPDSGLQSPLFGQPLATLCGTEETLPQALQDLLAILHREGPGTEGVFRKAANEKARRDLKEELNKGGTVDLAGRPVHLLAVVLKDFLRNIPSQLLSAALYESWMLALEKPSRQEKIEELKEVAAKLPRPNVLLLKPLLALLHRISQNAETNKMDSSNLAICVGPSMLSPGTESALPLQVQKEMNDKVCWPHQLAPRFGPHPSHPHRSHGHCKSSRKQRLGAPGAPRSGALRNGTGKSHRGAAASEVQLLEQKPQ
ncbi:T-cell activation Rho GTPase-activating protein-like [Struthio camelus]|uniref:T-cell activation Rho GTPase-activating protein-like n=1 Tax=Struthio camelus TaxID=8801 RepID=UPI0036040C09